MSNHSSRSDHLFDEAALIYTSTTSALSMVFIIWALITVYRHRRLSATVKFYLIFEHGLRLFSISLGYFWGASCILWYADQALPWLNYTFGFFFQATPLAVYCTQLFFSVNRFFAISFGGRYYKKLFSGRWMPQAVLFTPVALLPTTVTFFPGYRSFYDTSVYTFSIEGGILGLVLTIITRTLFALLVWTTTMILDIFMLIQLYKRRKNSALRSCALNTEWRLVLQMLINHVTNIFNGANSALLFALPIYSLFHMFLLQTVVLIVLPGLYGFSVVIFLGSWKKEQNRKVSPNADVTLMH